MTIDPKTHRLYLSAATMGPAPDGKAAAKGETKDEAKKAPAGKGAGGRRGSMVPGSFVVLVVTD
jgi:hypothetical protein